MSRAAETSGERGARAFCGCSRLHRAEGLSMAAPGGGRGRGGVRAEPRAGSLVRARMAAR